MENRRIPILHNLILGVADMPPAYFALVMATGIVSIAADALGWKFVALPLFWANIGFFIILWLLTFLRLAVYPKRMIADLRSHADGFGYLTIVAGSGLLGNQFLLIAKDVSLGFVLFVIASGVWLATIYAIMVTKITASDKPSVSQGMNGLWLLATVSTQSLSILITMLTSRLNWHEAGYFLGVCLFMVGGLLYLLIITLVFYRLAFTKLTPESLKPAYWIMMGADAITALAGSTLLENLNNSPSMQPMIPFLLGFTTFFWATSTWWIPLLFALGYWRHVMRHDPIDYTPQYWGMVFPLGMYNACTIHFARASHVESLVVIARYFFWVALAAWVLTFAGLIKRITEKLFARQDSTR